MRPRPLSDDMQNYLERLNRARRRRWHAAALVGAIAAGLVAVMMISWSSSRFQSTETPLQSSLRDTPQNTPVAKSTHRPEAPSAEEAESELFADETLTVRGPMFERSDAALSEGRPTAKRQAGRAWASWQELSDEFGAEAGRTIRMTAAGPMVLKPGEEFDWK